MLKYFVITVLLVISSASFAQSNEVVQAKMQYQEQNFLEAKDHIEKAILHEKTAKKSSTWLLRGDIYQQIVFHPDKNVKNSVPNAGRLAFESYQKALEVDKKMSRSKVSSKCEFVSNLTLNNGVLLFNNGDYAGAKSEFELCLEVAEWLEKTDSLVIFNLGMACERMKDYDCAMKYFKQCVDINYMRESSYESLGYCYMMKEDYAGAASVFKEGLTFYPNSNAMQTSLLNMYLFLGEDEKALTIIDRLIEAYPNVAQYYSVKGSTLSNLKRPDDALSALEKGLSLDPESFEMHFNMGSIYFNKGADIMIAASDEDDYEKADEISKQADQFFEKAKKHFEKAHSINPTDRGTMEGLKNVYAYTDDMEKFNEIKKKLSEY